MDEVDEGRFPEWAAFARAVEERDPRDGTWCEAWTVRDVVAHQVGNAEELARVLEAHLRGDPVQTRRFEEREAPLRVLDDRTLWAALRSRMAELSRVLRAAEPAPPDTRVA